MERCNKHKKALDAVEMIIKYIDEEEGKTTRSARWEDKDGDGFDADVGYFYEGLAACKEYLIEKVKRKCGHGRKEL